MTGKCSRFVVVVAFAGFLAFTLKQSGVGIFACNGNGYFADSYLADCSPLYGNFEVGAHMFGFSPVIDAAIDSAAVIFLGNSHVGFGLSNDIINNWFIERRQNYYLMHLPGQGDGGASRLLDRFQPHPKAVVINADPFFRIPANPSLFSDTVWERLHFETKRWWQVLHRELCGRWGGLCRGSGSVSFREQTTGRWILSWYGGTGRMRERFNVLEDPDRLLDTLPQLRAEAETFIAALPVSRQCVVMTSIPGNNTTPELARRLAAELGTAYIRPNLKGLTTIDGDHLTPESGEDWTRAFLDQFASVLDRCIGVSAGGRPLHSPG